MRALSPFCLIMISEQEKLILVYVLYLTYGEIVDRVNYASLAAFEAALEAVDAQSQVDVSQVTEEELWNLSESMRNLVVHPDMASLYRWWRELDTGFTPSGGWEPNQILHTHVVEDITDWPTEFPPEGPRTCDRRPERLADRVSSGSPTHHAIADPERLADRVSSGCPTTTLSPM